MIESFACIKELEDQNQLPTYAKYPIALEKGEGVYVYDSTGKKYLDMYGGHCVTVTGHCHPAVVSAITSQAQKLLFYSNAVYNSARAKASELLVNYAPESLTKVFFCNSGAEANETALKIALKHTGKSKIIAVSGDFHGRTAGALSVTGIEKFKAGLPTLPNVEFVPFGDVESVKSLISMGDVACVLIEPIQSMSGVMIANPEYYHDLRQLTEQEGVVLIYDEVQTGFGRTGDNFFGSTIIPDVICAAKSIASGLPMGAVFVNEEISKTVKIGDQGTTFGGGPVVCAAAAATMETLVKEQLGENAKVLGEYLKKESVQADINGLKEVRGMGLLLGFEFDYPVKLLISSLLESGIIVGSSLDGVTLRLLPPLVLEKNHCVKFLDTLKALASKVNLPGVGV